MLSTTQMLILLCCFLLKLWDICTTNMPFLKEMFSIIRALVLYPPKHSYIIFRGHLLRICVKMHKNVCPGWSLYSHISGKPENNFKHKQELLDT